MQIEHAIIADYAEVNGRKLYLMGGGWDTYRAPAIPAPVRMALALGIRVDWAETNQPLRITSILEDEDGKQMARIEGKLQVGRPAGLPPGSSQLAQMAVNFAISFQQYGGYRFRVIGESEAEGIEPVTRLVPFRVAEKRTS